MQGRKTAKGSNSRIENMSHHINSRNSGGNGRASRIEFSRQQTADSSGGDNGGSTTSSSSALHYGSDSGIEADKRKREREFGGEPDPERKKQTEASKEKEREDQS